jgi:hypothetical protein
MNIVLDTSDELIDRDGNRRRARAGEVLQDGERLRFPMLLLDSKGCQPGYRVKEGSNGDRLREARLKREHAYDDRSKWLTDAWRDGVKPKPEVRVSAGQISEIRDQAHKAYVNRITNAWREAQ